VTGIVVIDKPTGQTSFGVVREVRGLLGARKAGHTGTLDPLASGVLPVCIDEATKLVQFFSEDDKEYRATVQFGIETDTLDLEGKVLAVAPVRVGEEEIVEALSGFRGTQEQIPPRYSAVKVQGKPLYRWTRGGIPMEPPGRTVTVHRLELVRFDPPYGVFSIHCSKGTYVRSLCADLGRKLGCGATVSALRRTRCGRFSERDALSLQGLGQAEKRRLLEERLITLEEALEGMPSFVVDGETAKRIRNGRPPSEESLKKQVLPSLERGNLIQFLSEENRVVAIGKFQASPDAVSDGEGAIRLVRVFR
jgi:tRNA pseudouridine55 synthase